MKREFKFIAILLLIMTTIGCISLRIIKSPEKATIDKNSGLVYFYRPSILLAYLLTFKIGCNSEIIGAVKPGTYFYAYVKPGKNVISIEDIPHLVINIEAGKTYYVKIMPKIGRDEALIVEEEKGREEIRKYKYGLLDK